jgi:hypothetical protein
MQQPISRRYCRDSIEQPAAVPYNPDPQVLQILHRQFQQNGIVGLVLAESRFILTKAQASEPHSDIDGPALAGHGSCLCRPDSVSRLAPYCPWRVRRCFFLQSAAPFFPAANCETHQQPRLSQWGVVATQTRSIQAPVIAALEC